MNNEKRGGSAKRSEFTIMATASGSVQPGGLGKGEPLHNSKPIFL